MSEDIVRLIVNAEHLVNLTLLLPLALAWWRRPQLPAPLRRLAVLPGFLLVLYGAGVAATRLFHYNLAVGHATTFGEGVLLIWYLGRLLANTRYRGWPPVFQAVFVVFGLFDSFVLEGFHQLNTYTNALESLLVTALVLLHFEHLLSAPHLAPRLSREPTFAANVGIVLYLIGTVLFYLILNRYILLNDAALIYRLLTLSLLMRLVLSALLARCFWLARQPAPATALVAAG